MNKCNEFSKIDISASNTWNYNQLNQNFLQYIHNSNLQATTKSIGGINCSNHINVNLM